MCDETHGCKRGSMCNYENGESGFCTPCDHFTTAEECEEASFSDVQGTKDCLDKCILRGKYTQSADLALFHSCEVGL